VIPVFQSLPGITETPEERGALTVLTITNTSVTREQVWTAFRRTPDVRLRERYHTILLLMDGKSCPEVAQWRYLDEETVRAWVHALNETGLHGLKRATIPGRPT
jgi:hypothetical protein